MKRSTIFLACAAALLVASAFLAVRLGSADAVGPLVDGPENRSSEARSETPLALSAPEPHSSSARALDARSKVARPDAIPPGTEAARLVRAVVFLRALLPERFGHLTNEEAKGLTTLDLGGAKLRDGDLAHLAALPALDSVSLRGSDVTDAGLTDLRSVTKLKSVDLRATKATDLGVLALPTERLEALHLTDSAVNARDLLWLPAMPKLQVFKLNGLAMTDEALAGLDFLPALRHIEVDRTAVTNEGLRRFLDRNPAVQRVELRETGVTREAIAEFSQSHPGVELVDGRDFAMFGR